MVYKTKAGSDVRIFIEDSDWLYGAYDSPRGWIPVRWPRGTPFVSWRGQPSGLDLVKQIDTVRI